jgi:hypothetical protein
LADRALGYALGDILRKQENREAILGIAADDLNTSPPKEDAPQVIDDDWLDAFKRYAETKSNADIQQLWARILSAEIRKPGSSSLRTLAFLSTISSVDANFIVKAFTYVVNGSFIPAWVHDTGEVPYEDLLRLDDLGIIAELPGIGGTQFEKDSQRGTLGVTIVNLVGFIYFGKLYVYEHPSQELKWNVRICPLSQIGKELFVLTNSTTANHAALESFALATKPASCARVSVYNGIPAGGGLIPIGIPKVLFEATSS